MAHIICKECNSGFTVRNNRATSARFCSIKCFRRNTNYKVIPGTNNNFLTIIKEVDPEVQSSYGKRQLIRKIECGCDCGKVVVTRLTSFRSGYAKSCGCIPKIGRHDLSTTALSRHPLHRVWSNMIQRCTNKNNDSYKHYGGRGVTVCQEWLNSFKEFYEWAINSGWQMGLKLDKDIHGGMLYSPQTCVFLTDSENANLTSRNRVFYINGKRYTLQQLCEANKISRSAVEKKLKKGESIETAVIKRRR